jgi:CRISPR/Cas system-associated protein Cas10 (large subunit of type III CRISPR-Cas system)
LPVLRGIATRLWGGHCEVCGREDAKENSQSDDRLHDTFSTAAHDSYAFHRDDSDGDESRRKRGKSRGGMIIRFPRGRESDSFWECRRLPMLTAFRTPT